MKKTRARTNVAWRLCLTAALMLAGCSFVDQGKGGGAGGGYEKQIDSTTFVVTDYGGASGTYRKVNRWNLLHAAYVTDGHGFNYFIVADAKVDTVHGGALAGYLSQSDYGHQVKTVGEGWTSYEISRTIRLYRGGVPAGNAAAFDARTLIEDSAKVSD